MATYENKRSSKLRRQTEETRRRYMIEKIIAECGQERWDQYSAAEKKRIIIRYPDYIKPTPADKVALKEEEITCCDCGDLVFYVWMEVKNRVYCPKCYYWRWGAV